MSTAGRAVCGRRLQPPSPPGEEARCCSASAVTKKKLPGVIAPPTPSITPWSTLHWRMPRRNGCCSGRIARRTACTLDVSPEMMTSDGSGGGDAACVRGLVGHSRICSGSCSRTVCRTQLSLPGTSWWLYIPPGFAFFTPKYGPWFRTSGVAVCSAAPSVRRRGEYARLGEVVPGAQGMMEAEAHRFGVPPCSQLLRSFSNRTRTQERTKSGQGNSRGGQNFSTVLN